VDEPLSGLDVPRVVAHQHHLLSTGRSERTTREALVYLSGILQVAAEHGLIPANPVRAVRKPGGTSEEVRPLTPTQLEPSFNASLAESESWSSWLAISACARWSCALSNGAPGAARR
jgi:hypothetical protein